MKWIIIGFLFIFGLALVTAELSIGNRPGDIEKGVYILPPAVATSSSGNDTQKDTNGFYLYNDSSIVYFNETMLNATIDDRANVTAASGVDNTNIAYINNSQNWDYGQNLSQGAFTSEGGNFSASKFIAGLSSTLTAGFTFAGTSTGLFVDAAGADPQLRLVHNANDFITIHYAVTEYIYNHYKTAFPDGLVSAPSIFNTGDADTGIYFPKANAVGLVAGGIASLNTTGSNTEINRNITADAFKSRVDSYCNSTDCYDLAAFLLDTTGGSLDNTNIAYLNNTQNFSAHQSMGNITMAGGGGYNEIIFNNDGMFGKTSLKNSLLLSDAVITMPVLTTKLNGVSASDANSLADTDSATSISRKMAECIEHYGDRDNTLCFPANDQQAFTLTSGETYLSADRLGAKTNIHFAGYGVDFGLSSGNFIISGNADIRNLGGGGLTITGETSLNQTVTITDLQGSYGSGSAYVCVYDNGTLFASDSACP